MKKHPLNELFELYEATMAKPELREPESAAIDTPTTNYEDHPVIKDKNKIDALRLAGAAAPDAHEKVKGEVDVSDAESKADLAKTLSRTQQDGNRKSVYLDKDPEHPSLLAKDEEMEKKLTKVTDSDMKTPVDKEVPDALEPPEQVDTKEEYDYNDDVAYIQQYGRP